VSATWAAVSGRSAGDVRYRFRLVAALSSASQIALAAEDEQQLRIGVLLLDDEGSTGERAVVALRVCLLARTSRGRLEA
jgi:hypothetical protein